MPLLMQCAFLEAGAALARTGWMHLPAPLASGAALPQPGSPESPRRLRPAVTPNVPPPLRPKPPPASLVPCTVNPTSAFSRLHRNECGNALATGLINTLPPGTFRSGGQWRLLRWAYQYRWSVVHYGGTLHALSRAQTEDAKRAPKHHKRNGA